eukprot:3236997-Amphidinium_carterae.1
MHMTDADTGSECLLTLTAVRKFLGQVQDPHLVHGIWHPQSHPTYGKVEQLNRERRLERVGTM